MKIIWFILKLGHASHCFTNSSQPKERKRKLESFKWESRSTLSEYNNLLYLYCGRHIHANCSKTILVYLLPLILSPP